jgi:hypothetical protein
MFPPSMTYSLPVIEDERSEERNATNSATSSNGSCPDFCASSIISSRKAPSTKRQRAIAGGRTIAAAPEPGYIRCWTFHVPSICCIRVGAEFLLGVFSGAFWAYSTEHEATQQTLQVTTNERMRADRLIRGMFLYSFSTISARAWRPN